MPKVASNGTSNIKKKKDPNKPKGVKSAYIFFAESCKHDEHHTSDFSLFSKECGRKWKEMTNDDKQPFQKLSDGDKRRRDQEMKNYIPPEDSDDEDGFGGGGKKRKKKEKKDPNAPKRNLSAYFFYARFERPNVVSDLGANGANVKVTEVMKEIARRWNDLGAKATKGDPNAKLKVDEYQQMAKDDQVRYKNAMEQYQRSQQRLQYQQEQLQLQQLQRQQHQQHQQHQVVDDDEDEEYEEEYEE